MPNFDPDIENRQKKTNQKRSIIILAKILTILIKAIEILKVEL